MQLIHRLVNERFAKAASRFMKFVCYALMALCLLFLVLGFMGRQSFTLRTSTGTYENAIYAEEDHAPSSRSFTVSMTGDDIRVRANSEDRIDLATHIGLSLMFAFQILPMVLAYWLLSRVFSNISAGKIFTEQNAAYLLYYGVLQFFAALLVPLIKLLICFLTNLAADSQIAIAAGQKTGAMVSSIAFAVAAYIIHYGIHLQDEVDHTL